MPQRRVEKEKKPNQPNRASVRLARMIAVDREVLRAIAFECKVTEQAVKNWANGASKPMYEHRAWLEENRGFALDSWDRSPTSEAA